MAVSLPNIYSTSPKWLEKVTNNFLKLKDMDAYQFYSSWLSL